MAGRSRLWLGLVAVALALPLGWAGADHGGCPPFERLRYDYWMEFEHGGDLVSVLHVVGFTDFRFCYEIRDRVLLEEIRWEARGGEYLLRLVGADFEDVHVLRSGANATGWYEHGVINEIQVAGLSEGHKPTLILSEPPPMRGGASAHLALT